MECRGKHCIDTDWNTRALAAIHQGILITVVNARAEIAALEDEARAALHTLERNLRAIGSDKSSLLLVLVRLDDLNAKPEFERAWDGWTDRAATLVCAYVGAPLTKGNRLELVAAATEAKSSQAG